VTDTELIAALEIGISMRHALGSEIEVVLPPALCWAYPADTAVEKTGIV
jgi:hypothetical protein